MYIAINIPPKTKNISHESTVKNRKSRTKIKNVWIGMPVISCLYMYVWMYMYVCEDVKCVCVCVCVLLMNLWGTSCMNEVIPDLDRRHVASSKCSCMAGDTIRPCATHKDDTVILCGHNSVDTGAPQFITTPARKIYHAFLVVTYQAI